MFIRALAVAASLVLVFMFVGCSGNNPVDTDFASKASISSVGGDGVFMRAKLHLDADMMTATITPIRNNAAVGDYFADLEITSFLVYPFCSDATCLYVKGLGVEAGTPPDISMTIGVRHPFGVFNSALPPSGTNRADLDLFDLRVYLINDGGTAPNPAKETVTGLATTDIIFTPNFIVNADGYDNGADAKPVDAVDGLSLEELTEITSYTFGAAGSTTMQPYKRAFAGTADPFVFTPGGTPVADDNRYCHGETGEATFIINLAPGGGAIDFDLAVAGSFGASAQGKTNRTPANVKYFKAFRAQRPLIGLQEPPTTAGDSVGGTLPTLNFKIVHPWAGLAPAGDDAAYKIQGNNGELLPAGAKGPALTDLTFACRVTDGVNTYGYTTLPTGTGNGKDSDPWLFSLQLEDTSSPGNPIPDGTYSAYIYVLAATGTSTTYPYVGTDNYTLYYAMDLDVQTI